MRSSPALDPSLAASSNAVRGIALMVFFMAIVAAADAGAKWALAEFAILQVIFFRGLFAMLPMLLPILWRGEWHKLRPRRPRAVLLRGIVALLVMACYYYAFRHMPLADAYAIGFTAPLFMTLLSIPLLGEHVGIRRWTSTVIGFVAVLIMVRPGTALFDWPALVLLGGALLLALSRIWVRILVRHESNTVIVFYFMLLQALVTAPLLPWVWRTPDFADFCLLAAVGIGGGIGHLGVTQAFRLAAVSVVAPYEYTILLWGLLIGYIIWQDWPTAEVLLGAAIVIASGLYNLHRERVLVRRAAGKGR